MKITKSKRGDIVFDRYYEFQRPIGYKSSGHITTEDEIKDLCDRSRILVLKIEKFEGYRVTGTKKILRKATYKKAKDSLSKL